MTKSSTRSSQLNTRKRVQLKFTEPGLTEQTHKSECDINRIIKKFVNTGQLPTNISQNPQYGFAPEIDFKKALDLTKKLHSEFDSLTDSDKQKFNNDPAQYGEFLSQYAEAPESFYNIEDAEPETLVSQTKTTPSKRGSDPVSEQALAPAKPVLT